MSGEGVELVERTVRPLESGALADRLVPDELWEIVRPLLPTVKVRPQGGGARRVNDRPILVGIVYIVMTGTAWRKVPSWYWGATHATLYRRFVEWTSAEVWDQLLRAIPPDHGGDCWCRAVAIRAKQHAADQPLRQVHRTGLAAQAISAAAGAQSVMNSTDHAVFH